MTVVHNDMHTHEQFLKMTLRLCLGFSLHLGLLFMPFCHVVHVLFALGLVFSVLSQEIG